MAKFLNRFDFDSEGFKSINHDSIQSESVPSAPRLSDNFLKL